MMTIEMGTSTNYRASDVGIIAMDIYFPPWYVDQKELEEHDGVSPGKYTVGLEQEKMAVCPENEDAISMAMNAVSRLMKKNKIEYKDIGRLEVGSESNPDRSKSIKTFLMQLFEDTTINRNVCGTDCVNACFGGTAALMNSINWIESREWDGRYALVVATDVAVYDKGPARPTGGAGAVALLLGPNAPIVIERGISFTYMDHRFDFYKADPNSEYPIVDGPLSIESYIGAFRACTLGLVQKIKTQTGEMINPLTFFDYFLFHSPYGKLVRKAFAELPSLDYNQHPFEQFDCYGNVYYGKDDSSGPFVPVPRRSEELKAKLAALVEASRSDFEAKVKPGLAASKVLGNLYCASVFANLISLIQQVKDEELVGKRVGVFSFGSGLASMFYSLKIQGSVSEMRKKIDLKRRLSKREKISMYTFENLMTLREERFGWKDWAPELEKGDTKGLYYFEAIDHRFCRYYDKLE